MRIKIIDVCGREPPQVVDLGELDLPEDCVDHVLDHIAESGVAYLGEFEYREAQENC